MAALLFAFIVLLLGVGFVAVVAVAAVGLPRIRERRRRVSAEEAEESVLASGGIATPTNEGDGLRKIALGSDEFRAGLVAARLENDGVRVSVDSSTAAHGSTIASYTLLYSEADEAAVIAAVSELLPDQ